MRSVPNRVNEIPRFGIERKEQAGGRTVLHSDGVLVLTLTLGRVTRNFIRLADRWWHDRHRHVSYRCPADHVAQPARRPSGDASLVGGRRRSGRRGEFADRDGVVGEQRWTPADRRWRR